MRHLTERAEYFPGSSVLEDQDDASYELRSVFLSPSEEFVGLGLLNARGCL